ncbi:DUF2807 domain-containing protein [Bacteroidales bacterium OttesenSCG-928-K03]|nr:DUF2807 domain-containing protein [Odoribacter sp. OttesenSCG-928-L07]MDL2239112.1 DUF2807 domain-containing protein [Bacteroidales bacterium OttesenSCG-928-L14]MDL2240025.1 DUF2807 domain-containing protein [Bacteroidales bacterium OttesenSCG-928-K22]MDL2242263.1 DUF2807 domain-containing protein [Bacteroidales bacterium OttesenSCG-928-K03]
MKKLIKSTTLIFAIVALNCFTSCNIINGNGDIIEIEENFQSFNKVVSDGCFDVFIHNSDTYSATVIAPSNIQPYVILKVNDKKLTIRKKQNINFNTNKPIEVHVYCQQLEGVINNGSGNISADDILTENYMEIVVNGSGDLEMGNIPECENIKIKVSGSGKINIHQIDFCKYCDIVVSGSGSCTIGNILNEELMVKISGSGKVNLAGENYYTNIIVSGSGDYRAYDLLSNIYDAKVSGSGTSQISVSDKLTARINGSGSIYYYGYPQIDFTGGGSGRLISMN